MEKVNVTLNWTGGKAFTATNGTGCQIVLDGRKEAGPSPMDLLLQALGGCSAIDIVVIMEKVRTPLSRFEMTIEGVRNETDPKFYTGAVLRFDVWGEGINPDKLNRAINLSIFKYCSVYHSLRTDLRLQAEYRIHSNGTEASGEYQQVEMSVPTGELQ
ncbi:MAG: OsmC family protein [Blastocatellia bacterium]